VKLIHEESRRLIRTRSVGAEGNEELALHLAELLRARGIAAKSQPVAHSLDGVSKRQHNVIGILGDPLVDRKTRRGLLLHTHVDTPAATTPEQWSDAAGDPFGGTIRDGKICGLGASDAKLDFLCKLRAIEKFRDQKLKQPIYLAASCGQTLGNLGARYLIQSRALNPSMVLVGAPTECRVVTAQKGALILSFEIQFQWMERDAKGFNRRIVLHTQGRTGHAAFPSFGVNALDQLLEFMAASIEKGFDPRITRIGTGGERDLFRHAAAQIPDRATAEFFMTSQQFEDFKRYFREQARQFGDEKLHRVELGGLGDSGVRFLPKEALAALMELALELRKSPNAQAVLTEIGVSGSTLRITAHLSVGASMDGKRVEEEVRASLAALQARYPKFAVSVKREGWVGPLHGTESAEWRDECLRAGEAGEELGMATEASEYAQAGYPVVIFGPGRFSGNGWCPNEACDLDQLEVATSFYEKIIERTCL